MNGAHWKEANTEFSRLRRFEGETAEFWPLYLGCLGKASEANRVFLAVRQQEGNAGAPEQSAQWRLVAVWPKKTGNPFKDVPRLLESLCEEACDRRLALSDTAFGGGTLVAMALEGAEEQPPAVVLFLLPEPNGSKAEETIEALLPVADVPGSYWETRAGRRARRDVEHLYAAVDLVAQINSEERFLTAVMIVCNEIASRLNCERVCLGWLENGQVRLKAISHSEKFEKKMESVRLLELAMEECVDQDEEIVWPQPAEAATVARDHSTYANEVKTHFLCSVPVRIGQQVHAVLTCERQENAFDSESVARLRLWVDQVVRRLSDLKARDRWFGARMAAGARRKAAGLLGPDYTWWKIAGVLVAVLLGVLFFGRMTYRVEASFVLRSEQVAYLTAPFDGYIQEVMVEPGDRVEEGAVLSVFDRRDLLQERAIAQADLTRHSREVEQARAENRFAEMRIAQARVDQVSAQSEMLEYRLEQSEIKSPFEGFVIEGDLREQIGAPVNAGEVLFQVAQLDEMYVEGRVNERDIHELSVGDRGEMAFASQPRLKFPFEVERLEPAASESEEGNVFLVRLDITEDLQDWWRPGMSGVAKIEVGRRSILWILTHRTLDYFRLNWWWW